MPNTLCPILSGSTCAHDILISTCIGDRAAWVAKQLKTMIMEMQMQWRNVITKVALTIQLFASFASAQDMEGRFSEFRVGDRCSVITAVMGDPTSTSTGSTLGISHSRIRWVSGSRVYVAVCISEWLVSKRVCQALPDC
jgi:hypothetical protein